MSETKEIRRHEATVDGLTSWAVYDEVDPEAGPMSSTVLRATIWTYNHEDGEMSAALKVEATDFDLTHRAIRGVTLAETIVYGRIAADIAGRLHGYADEARKRELRRAFADGWFTACPKAGLENHEDCQDAWGGSETRRVAHGEAVA